MALPNLKEFSPEQRREFLENARIASEAKKEAGKYLRQDWLDAPLWDFLRSKTKVKAPLYYIPASETKHVSRTLKKIGKDNLWWKEHFCKSAPEWSKLNPAAPAYVLQGLMLEAAYPELVATFRVEETIENE